MSDDTNTTIKDIRNQLLEKLDGLEDKSAILKSDELKSLYDQLKTMPPENRGSFGKEVNELRNELLEIVNSSKAVNISNLNPIDVTAPFDINQSEADELDLLPSSLGTIHPLMREMDEILDIFYRLGFKSIQTPEIDDDYHMFGSLNFPEGHPARDDFDTLTTKQIEPTSNKPYVAPAHTSTMQIRVLKDNLKKLEEGEPIAYVIPGRVFRNEDVDPRHEHTFYQLEGVYVGKNVTVANLMATLKLFMQEYYQRDIELKTQPFYFPFTEPSFEFSISCPYCDKKGCRVCSQSGWIELVGCGMTHPNVYKSAGIDPEVYTGFAWGIGFMRMAMIKYGIEDIRYFQSGQLNFLRQF